MTMWLISSTGAGTEVAFFVHRDEALAFQAAHPGYNLTEVRVAQYQTVTLGTVNLG